MSPRIAILGGGAMGQAVAEILSEAGADTTMWVRRPAARRALAKKRPKVAQAKSVAEAGAEADLVFVAVPAGAFREVVAAFGEAARPDHLLVHATRGVDGHFVLPHQVVREETCVRKIGVLGGPLHARDLVSGHPIAAVLASRFDETLAAVRAAVAGGAVHVHPSHDVVGVEVAGAIANVTALAVGMADQLGLGDTARGVLLTRGLVEASQVGRALGAEATTFAGLAGIGDLIPRRVAATERHHQVGAAVAQGTPLDAALAAAKGEVEGVHTAAAALDVADRLGLELPLAAAVHRILHGEAEAGPTLEAVLQLDLELAAGLRLRA